ncbi:hypothetical protein BV22DRAFT_903803 [Leucogyrophana mollusca]|uniref:Uncharacterized protein n=1 Tax=Leucogyrophana mollusca TaxID=85980 RepID=A0ACB8AZ63_9AGAM|nr:hypothetical protein BV22DRAFT_903803 [Leucogyrophana mollusca]
MCSFSQRLPLLADRNRRARVRQAAVFSCFLRAYMQTPRNHCASPCRISNPTERTYHGRGICPLHWRQTSKLVPSGTRTALIRFSSSCANPPPPSSRLHSYGTPALCYRRRTFHLAAW